MHLTVFYTRVCVLHRETDNMLYRKARANNDQHDLRRLLLFEVTLGHEDQSLALVLLRDGYTLDQICYFVLYSTNLF